MLSESEHVGYLLPVVAVSLNVFTIQFDSLLP